MAAKTVSAAVQHIDEGGLGELKQRTSVYRIGGRQTVISKATQDVWRLSTAPAMSFSCHSLCEDLQLTARALVGAMHHILNVTSEKYAIEPLTDGPVPEHHSG